MKSAISRDRTQKNLGISLSSPNHSPEKRYSIDLRDLSQSSKTPKSLGIDLKTTYLCKLKPPLGSTRRVSLASTPRGMSDSSLKFGLRTMKSLSSSNEKTSELSANQASTTLKAKWEDIEKPISPTTVISLFSDFIPFWEQLEISKYSDIFYIGKNFKPKDPHFDDENGDYKLLIKDHIAFRFEVIALIGKGSFGQVLEVFDHKTKKSVALKIVKNKPKFHQQAQIEVEILKFIKSFDKQKSSNIIEILETFTFRNHICITFDLYSLNLYELLKRNSFKGLSLAFIKKIAFQLFNSLNTLANCSIIHCDIKPENILLMHLTRPNVKLIDLGSSCFTSQRMYTYIQSRFYRAPEVILGIPYSISIDTWSLGCVLFELFTGIPLFPGESEGDQLLCIMEVLGLPPLQLLQKATKKSVFFDDFGEPKIKTNNRGKRRIPNSRSLKNIMKGADKEFFDIVEACLQWDPELRIKPRDALRNEYFEEPVTPDTKIVKHKKISLEDITRHVPNLQKFIAHRKRLSEA